jgi:hypothetical protein
VGLKENPGLYTVLHDKNAYEKYVRLDEGHGLVILDPSAAAAELVKMYARDDSFYEVSLMKDAITKLFGYNDVGILHVIEKASNKDRRTSILQNGLANWGVLLRSNSLL